MGLQIARRAMDLPVKLPQHNQDNISFGAGDACPHLFPDLTAESTLALTRYRSETLQYATSRLGLASLREWIAGYMKADGIAISPDQILVVNGAKHGLDLVCRLFINEGDCVAVTAPTYFTGIPILRSHGVTFLEVPQDEEGLSVQHLADETNRRKRIGESLPKLIYDVPDFHNPTGICMSERRRVELVQFAASNNIPIIEDSPYRQVRFEGKTIPSLKSLDRNGVVVQLGTFSKLLSPGLRVGWITTSEDHVIRMAQLKSDGGSCPLTQRIVYEYCSAGKLSAHLERIRSVYREHRDTMIEALRGLAPELSFRIPEGGYYIWIRLPKGINAESLAHAALGRGLEVIPGIRFFATTNGASAAGTTPGQGFIRLAYSFVEKQKIYDGVQRLVSALHREGSGGN